MTAPTIDTSAIVFLSGKHDPPTAEALAGLLGTDGPPDLSGIKACVMEWEYLIDCLERGIPIDKIIAGWTDHPPCTPPSITNALIAFNDRCGSDNERRGRLLKQVLDDVRRVSAGSKALEQRRLWAMTDWGIRLATPKLLRATCLESLTTWADKLEKLPPITSDKKLGQAKQVIYDCREAAWNERSRALARLRADAAAVADAAADAVADAVADAAADADAAAAAVAAADAAADAVAAADAAADAVAAKIFGTPPTEEFLRIVGVAKSAREAGGDYWAQYYATKKVASEVFAKKPELLVKGKLLAVRDEVDAEFALLIKRVCAMKDET
jgi:hypothetical protein